MYHLSSMSGKLRSLAPDAPYEKIPRGNSHGAYEEITKSRIIS